MRQTETTQTDQQNLVCLWKLNFPSFTYGTIRPAYPSHSISPCYNDNEGAIWQTQTQMRATLGQLTSSRVFTWQQQQKKRSILTIRTGCEGGATDVCRVGVCFPACALISTFADSSQSERSEVSERNYSQPQGLVDRIWLSRLENDKHHLRCFQISQIISKIILMPH